jgi:hypothetical protein
VEQVGAVSADLLFPLALTSVILGHAAGLLAWRKRRQGVAFWRWMFDPLYFVRPSYYDTRLSAIRVVAGVFFLVGVIALILLVLGEARGA